MSFARTTYIPKHCVVAVEIEACRVNLFRFREYLNGFTVSPQELLVSRDSASVLRLFRRISRNWSYSIAAGS